MEFIKENKHKLTTIQEILKKFGEFKTSNNF